MSKESRLASAICMADLSYIREVNPTQLRISWINSRNNGKPPKNGRSYYLVGVIMSSYLLHTGICVQFGQWVWSTWNQVSSVSLNRRRFPMLRHNIKDTHKFGYSYWSCHGVVNGQNIVRNFQCHWNALAYWQRYVFGHYARVLVDMELSRHIFHEIMVGRKSFSSKVEVTYEWLSAICTHFKNIEHGVAKVDRENIEK